MILVRQTNLSLAAQLHANSDLSKAGLYPRRTRKKVGNGMVVGFVYIPFDWNNAKVLLSGSWSMAK